MTIPYKGLHWVANTVERLFFNSYTVTFTEPSQQAMPEGGIVVMANHNYHMNDSATIQRLFGLLGRDDVYFVAYSTLYQGMLLGWLYSKMPPGTRREQLEKLEDTARLAALRNLHMLPIHREKDGKGDFHSQKQNLTDYIDGAARKAAEGHIVVIYPDGGSPDGYAHDPVKAGAVHMALRAAELGKELGNPVSLVCLGITYSSFHEPLFSDVEVRVAEIESLTDLVSSPADVKKNRKPLMKRIEQRIRSHIVQAPYDRTRAIEVLSAFGRTEQPKSNHLRVKNAAHKAEYLADFEPEEWGKLSSSLEQYGNLASRLYLRPGSELEASTVNTGAVLKAAGVYVALLPFLAPLLLIAKMTAEYPQELHRRGQQLMGTAASILLLWVLLLGGTDFALVQLDAIGVFAGLLWFGGTITCGVLAIKGFSAAQLTALKVLKPSLFREYQAKSAEIVGMLSTYSGSGTQ
jgi:1-acyl-sn-glycerol-3-phosphate acyltransferase